MIPVREAKNTIQDKREFTLLIEKHKGAIIYTLKKYEFIDSFNWDDYFQQVLLTAWLAYGNYIPREGGKFGLWLIKVAEHSILKYRRDVLKERYSTQSIDELFARDKFEIPDTPYEEDHMESLQRVYDDLSDYDKKVVDLFMSGQYLDGSDLSEDKPERYVSRRFLTIIKDIRAQSARYFDGLSIRDKYIRNQRFITGRTGEMNGRARPVLQIDKTGTVIKEWTCIAEAMRSGYSKSSIEKCLNGQRKEHAGFLWVRSNQKQTA